ncbi:unnamed protein product [Owenia fusiformis]|uniref:Uncharacterized protein n=1 Tax=Owenia fusiformis TaxID=6347 RepID=A0A8J1T657_OWEFU|nr:unnamed protein product [Owenia fusiformis]
MATFGSSQKLFIILVYFKTFEFGYGACDVDLKSVAYDDPVVSDPGVSSYIKIDGKTLVDVPTTSRGIFFVTVDMCQKTCVRKQVISFDLLDEASSLKCKDFVSQQTNGMVVMGIVSGDVIGGGVSPASNCLDELIMWGIDISMYTYRSSNIFITTVGFPLATMMTSSPSSLGPTQLATIYEIPSTDMVDLGSVCVPNENDAIYSNILTYEECKQLCLDETSFLCWSVEWQPNKNCQLSKKYSGNFNLAIPCHVDLLFSERIPLQATCKPFFFIETMAMAHPGSKTLETVSFYYKSSYTACARLCAKNDECFAFYLDDNAGDCETIDTNNPAVVKQGWKLFVKY